MALEHKAQIFVGVSVLNENVVPVVGFNAGKALTLRNFCVEPAQFFVRGGKRTSTF